MRICPFVSHMLGDESSNLLTIGDDRSEAGTGKPEPDVVIMGYGPDAASQGTEEKGRENEAITSHLYCLRESCRFYHEENGACQFDMMFSAMHDGDDRSAHLDEISKNLTRDMDKVWKFQTKSVTEIVEAMSESDRRQDDALKALCGEFDQFLERLRESASSPAGLGDKIDGLAKRIEKRDDGLDDLATTMSDVVINLNESIDALRKQSDEIAERVSQVNQGPDEDTIRAWLEESLHTRNDDVADVANSIVALEQRIETLLRDTKRGPSVETQLGDALASQQQMETRMRTWHDEISQTLKVLTARQDQWKQRIDEMAEQYDRLSGYLEEGEKQRQKDQVRTGKKEARKFNNLGVTSFHNGAFEMAREQFMQAVKVDPEFAEAYNNLGLAYTELAQEDKASDSFRRAIELNPSLHAAYNNLGYIFYRQGQYDQAIEMYNEALGRSTNNSSAYTNLGNAYYKLGELDEARKSWLRALELDPANEKAKRNLDRLREEISR